MKPFKFAFVQAFLLCLILFPNCAVVEEDRYPNFHDLNKVSSNTINARYMLDKNTTKGLANLELVNLIKILKNVRAPSKDCSLALLKLFGPVLNIKELTPKTLLYILSQPVGKVLDSWGKPPERILLGNLLWLGAYDECSAIEGMKYCRSTMEFASVADGAYGFCFPKNCSIADLNSIIVQVNNYTKPAIQFNQDLTCDKESVYDSGSKAALVVCGLLVLLCLVGTCFDLLSSYKNVPYTGMEDVPPHATILKSQVEEEGTSTRLTEPTTKSGLVHDVLMSLSILKNTKSILSTASPKGAITSINGIRTISMAWVIVGHSYEFSGILKSVDNPLPTSELLHNFEFMAISNGEFSVDTFFVLSGILVAYLTIRRLDKSPMSLMKTILLILKSNLHRFIRLTPSLLFTILFYNDIFPLLLRGPTSMTTQNTKKWRAGCNNYWWTTILYINNFYPNSYNKGLQGSTVWFAKDFAPNMCIGWTWYLANDMQFYLFAPVILIPMLIMERKISNKLQRVLPIAYVGCWIALFLAITAALLGKFDLPIIKQPYNKRSERIGEYLKYIYTKPYTRISPYLVGLILGYVFSRKLWFKPNYRKIFVAVGWIFAFAAGFLVVYGPYWKVVQSNATFFNDAQRTIYGTFMRAAWAMAVSWVIYACHNKAGGMIDSFLSWKIWIPLSRLTYGAYLLHILVIYFYLMSTETVLHYQHTLFVFDLVSIVFISYVSSLLMALFVEYPVLNLEKRFLG